jgi:hypothetical protein
MGQEVIEGKDENVSVRGKREVKVYTSLLEKLWLSTYFELKWDTYEEMPSNLYIYYNIFFCHFCIYVS